MRKPVFTFRYKIRNWPAYNRALVRRGQLTLWFDERAIAAWRDTAHSSAPGRPKVYADAAIECALVLKSVFHLSLRATQGFLGSAVTLLGLGLPVPDYSTMSRRQAGLAISLLPASRSGARHVVVDSTGLKVYGAGEWHAGKYHRTRRRVWRKLHLGVDETTREILAADVTDSRIHDSRRLPTLLSLIPRAIVQVSSDRGYDTRAVYEAVLARGAVTTIVPRRNARMSDGTDPPPWRVARNATLRAIEVQGRYGWRTSSGCSRQSLAENAMFRFKTVFGSKLRARAFDNQQVEAAIKCAVLNRMTGLGMPHTLRVL
jgi:Transposase DDE domain